MTIWSEENAKRILDRLCEHPSVTGASTLVGGSSKIVWVWANHSARDKAQSVADSKYVITGWPDEDCPPMFFHDAIELARKIHILNLDADTRELLNGVERPVIEGGKFQYVVDPLVIAQYPDAKTAKDLGGLDDWPYAHDERGARIVLTVKEHVSSQLKIHALRALAGPRWNPPAVSEATVKHQSFMIIGKQKSPERRQSPLVEDLRTRLEKLRAAKEGERITQPQGKVDIQGRGSNGMDPPERQSRPNSDPEPNRPQPQPAPAPEQPPKPDYSRPKQHSRLDGEDQVRRPPGGFSAATGKMT